MATTAPLLFPRSVFRPPAKLVRSQKPQDPPPAVPVWAPPQGQEAPIDQPHPVPPHPRSSEAILFSGSFSCGFNGLPGRLASGPMMMNGGGFNPPQAPRPPVPQQRSLSFLPEEQRYPLPPPGHSVLSVVPQPSQAPGPAPRQSHQPYALQSSAHPPQLLPTAAPFQPKSLSPESLEAVPASSSAAIPTPPSFPSNAEGRYSLNEFESLCGSQGPLSDALVTLLLEMLPSSEASLPEHLAHHPLVTSKQASSTLSTPLEGRGGYFSSRSSRAKPERQIHHKVMSVLSRVTPQKYDELHRELLELPLRQTDNEQLDKVVHVFFHKAVEEPKFSHLYAALVQSIFDTAEKEAVAAANNATLESPLTPTAESADRTSLLANRLRTALLSRCQHEFQRKFYLEAHELRGPDGVELSAEEAEDKQQQLKKRMCGNVRFVGELYTLTIVTDRVIASILQSLKEAELALLQRLQDSAGARRRADPLQPTPGVLTAGEQRSLDDIAEIFHTMLTTVGAVFSRRMGDTLSGFMDVVRRLSLIHPTARIRFLMMNLVELGDRRWDLGRKSIPSTPVTPLPRSSAKTATVSSPTARFGSSIRSNIADTGSSPEASQTRFAGLRPSTVPRRTIIGKSPTFPVEPKKKQSAGRRATAGVSCTESDDLARSQSPTPSDQCTFAAARSPVQPCVPDEVSRCSSTSVPPVTPHPAVAEECSLPGDLPDDELAAVRDTLRCLGDCAARAPATLRSELEQRLRSMAATRKRGGERRGAGVLLHQLWAAGPLVDGTPRPWFTLNELQHVVTGCVRADVADGIFDDSPTLFENWMEMVTAEAVLPAEEPRVLSVVVRDMADELARSSSDSNAIASFVAAALGSFDEAATAVCPLASIVASAVAHGSRDVVAGVLEAIQAVSAKRLHCQAVSAFCGGRGKCHRAALGLMAAEVLGHGDAGSSRVAAMAVQEKSVRAALTATPSPPTIQAMKTCGADAVRRALKTLLEAEGLCNEEVTTAVDIAAAKWIAV